MNILFFCNSNKSVGIGHLSRCIIIANSLLKLNKNLKISFFGDIDMEFLKLKKINIDNFQFDGNLDKYDAIIFDSYLEEDYLNINQIQTRRIALDDLEKNDYLDWNLVVNFRHKKEYKEYKSQNSKYGLKYFPFDKKYSNLRKKQTTKDLKNLFFYFGETVQIEITSDSINLIKEYKDKFNFYFYTQTKNSNNLFYSIDSNNFFEYFIKADLIIHGGGLTKYESSYSKKLNLSFSINELQKRDTEYLASCNLTNDMGYFQDIYSSIKKSIEFSLNLKHYDVDNFNNSAEKYFFDDSLDNIIKEINKVLIS